jgi:hypothetical protein
LHFFEHTVSAVPQKQRCFPSYTVDSLLTVSTLASTRAIHPSRDCTPNLVDGTWKCCYPDLVDGGLRCSAGSSLSVPRIFALPAVIFKTLSSIPGALAAVIPGTASSLEVDKRQNCSPNLVDGTWKCCWPDVVDGTLPCSAGSSLSPPRIFALPTLVFKALSSIPQAIAAAIPEKTSIPRVDKRQSHCTVNLVDGTWTCPPAGQCICDMVTGDCWNCSAGSSLSPPGIFAFPALLFKILSSIPHAIAAAVPNPLPIPRSPSEENHIEERQGTVSNCWINEMGMRQCFTFTPNAASSSLRIPRLFALPTILFKATSSLPKAIAAAVPPYPRGNPEAHGAPTPVKKEERDSQYTIPSTVCFWGENGKQCVSTSGISSLSIPRIFSLPTLFITLIKQVLSVSALPQHFTESLAAPNFDLVRKTIHEAEEALNNWVEERQLPICRPGQPENLPCKNSALRFGLSYLFSIPLLAFGVMVWL